MAEKILQCCYTNACREIGGKLSSGWQAVAVSNDIPPDAYRKCIDLQNADSVIPTKMEDERGKVLNLSTLAGDGKYVYMIRTQYGLLDRLGRPNMFSHAYIFSWKDERVLTDPNTFLTVIGENFKDNEAEALVMVSPAALELKRTAPFHIDSALEIAGMTEEAYLTLIRCVYVQMTEKKTAKTLYVQYDGSDRQMRALLYCIYYGVPYYMRKNLSAASAAVNGGADKNLIFSEFAKKYDTYVIPQTGENTILSPKLKRRIDRYGFVLFAAGNRSKLNMESPPHLRSAESMEEYFAQLNETAIKLGDSTASKALVLKIAHQIVSDDKIEDLRDEELESRLSDALRSESGGNSLMEEYVAELLFHIYERGMVLSDESEAKLSTLFAKEKRIYDARAYIKNLGKEVQIIRRWLRELRQAKKRRRLEEVKRWKETEQASKEGMSVGGKFRITL